MFLFFSDFSDPKDSKMSNTQPDGEVGHINNYLKPQFITEILRMCLVRESPSSPQPLVRNDCVRGAWLA